MNIKSILLISIFCLTIPPFLFAEADKESKRDFVPDEETAIRIAVAVWIPIYGKENIEREKPYNAVLRNGVWHVTGSLPCPAGQHCKGGVAEAEIEKENGCILKVSHGK